MARPREFNLEQATGKALEVFWEYGYEGASLPDLLAGMNITRGSLYKAFQDKKSLFLLVLERYETAAVAQAVELLTDPRIPDGWDRITRLFDSVATDVESGDRRGCLVCSAAAGPASYDQDIAQTVNRVLDAMHKAFAQAIRETDGVASDVSPDVSEKLAHMLVSQYVGLRVLTRSNVQADVIRQSVTAICRLRP